MKEQRAKIKGQRQKIKDENRKAHDPVPSYPEHQTEDK